MDIWIGGDCASAAGRSDMDEVRLIQRRCRVTRNLCGTDTWPADRPCACDQCHAWLWESFTAARAEGDGQRARADGWARQEQYARMECSELRTHLAAARAEVERLAGERDRWRIEAEAVGLECEHERAQADALRGALERLEWTFHDSDRERGARCPACGWFRTEGHRYDCSTELALAATPLPTRRDTPDDPARINGAPIVARACKAAGYHDSAVLEPNLWNALVAEVEMLQRQIPARRAAEQTVDGAFTLPTSVVDVIAELARARESFSPFHSAHEGYAVIAEELDELWDEVKGHYGPERTAKMRKEAIQVAAMAIRFIEDVCDR